jgi:hypothetical protein
VTVSPAVASGAIMEVVAKAKQAASAAQSANNLKQMALAMHNYHASENYFPPPAITSKDGKPLLSWRVAILPYIEQDNLYRQFKLDEPWDSEHNKKLIPMMPKVYVSADRPTKQPFTTYYQVLTGKGTVFEGPKGVQIQKITDGTSNTILIVEAGEEVPWTKPADLAYDEKKPLPRFADLNGAFWAAFCDGSVRRIKTKTDEQTLRNLITKDDGQVIGDF